MVFIDISGNDMLYQAMEAACLSVCLRASPKKSEINRILRAAMITATSPFIQSGVQNFRGVIEMNIYDNLHFSREFGNRQQWFATLLAPDLAGKFGKVVCVDS